MNYGPFHYAKSLVDVFTSQSALFSHFKTISWDESILTNIRVDSFFQKGIASRRRHSNTWPFDDEYGAPLKHVMIKQYGCKRCISYLNIVVI